MVITGFFVGAVFYALMFGNEQWMAAGCGAEHKENQVTQGTRLQVGVTRAAHFAQLLVMQDAGYGGSVEVSRYAGDDTWCD
jgi:hypothetical protein